MCSDNTPLKLVSNQTGLQSVLFALCPSKKSLSEHKPPNQSASGASKRITVLHPEGQPPLVLNSGGLVG